HRHKPTNVADPLIVDWIGEGGGRRPLQPLQPCRCIQLDRTFRLKRELDFGPRFAPAPCQPDPRCCACHTDPHIPPKCYPTSLRPRPPDTAAPFATLLAARKLRPVMMMLSA